MFTPQQLATDRVKIRALSAGLLSQDVAVLHQDMELTYDVVENLPQGWPIQDLFGKSDIGMLATTWAEHWFEAKRVVLSSGDPRKMDIDLDGSGTRQLLEAHIVRDTDGAGFPCGLITVLTDVTSLREREMAVASLMREVSHRSKNMLAIVQSIATQTARHSDTIATFLHKFRARLQALSGIQDLVTESNWRGTLFKTLVESQLAHAGQTSLEPVRISGDNPMLGPNAALHIGLALHELGTNARHYGALSSLGSGTIGISCTIVPTGPAEREMVFEWQETSPTIRPASALPRFGTMVLERIVPLSMGGRAEHDMSEEAILYRLHVPAGHFET